MTPSPPAQAEARETVEQIASAVVPSIEVTDAHFGKIDLQLKIAAKAYAQAALDVYISEVRPAVAAALKSERDSRDRRIAELEAALERVVAEWVNPGDGAPFEDGEVPALDQARRALTPGENS